MQLSSLAGADHVTRAAVRLWPTARRFGRGHRIRVLVSSGALPRYARTHRTGETHAATGLRAADQAVSQDGEHHSAITLPVRTGGQR